MKRTHDIEKGKISDNERPITFEERVYFDIIVNLAQNTGQLVSTWLLPLFMLLQILFKQELGISAPGELIFLFIVFSIIQAIFQIFIDIIVNNANYVVCGRDMAKVLKDCRKLYNDRKHKWILCDDSAIDYSKHNVPKMAPDMVKLFS